MKKCKRLVVLFVVLCSGLAVPILQADDVDEQEVQVFCTLRAVIQGNLSGKMSEAQKANLYNKMRSEMPHDEFLDFIQGIIHDEREVVNNGVVVEYEVIKRNIFENPDEDEVEMLNYCDPNISFENAYSKFMELMDIEMQKTEL